jgi:hypothetical protein
MGIKIIPSGPDTRTELQRFAAWFNQDFIILFPVVQEGVEAYFSGLPLDAKRTLREQLSAFVESYAERSYPVRTIKKAWLKLGAGSTPPDLISTLRGAIRTLEEQLS